MQTKMAKRLFLGYQLFAVFLICPLAYILWLERLQGQHRLVLYLYLVPVLFGYIAPAIGTNLLKLWEFKAGIRLGRFTLVHGFMLGGPSVLLAWLCADIFLAGPGWLQTLKSAMVLGPLIGFWNWWFDTWAIRNGIAVMYNKPAYEGKSAASITGDYAPLYYGIFGAGFGVYIHFIFERQVMEGSGSLQILLVVFSVITIIAPAAGHALFSYYKHGYWGLTPYLSDRQNLLENQNEV
ncbi:MAG: hypothetical protein HQK83_06290 [Fibrobacteria bacterium]|nr:hypothetical protein [Fibrobacteria bacterium]